VFRKVLIVNRGVVAVRVVDRWRRMEGACMEVSTEAESELPRVAVADDAPPLGGVVR
jgi:acetyl/propionyl-CoA carboxylase alpha subunit